MSFVPEYGSFSGYGYFRTGNDFYLKAYIPGKEGFLGVNVKFLSDKVIDALLQAVLAKSPKEFPQFVDALSVERSPNPLKYEDFQKDKYEDFQKDSDRLTYVIANLNEDSQLTLEDRVLKSKNGVEDNKVWLSCERVRKEEGPPKGKEIKSKDSSKPKETIKIFARWYDNKGQKIVKPLKDIKNVNFSIDTSKLKEALQMDSEKQYENDDEDQ
jgi:hypothetical protein